MKWTYSEQEQNIILSNLYMTANADRNVCILIHNAKPFEDETDGKEHSESQNKQQVLGSNQNDRPVNLSAQVQDVNKTCGLVYVFNLFGFTFHTSFWVDNKHDTGETKSWQNDEEAAHSDSKGRDTRCNIARNIACNRFLVVWTHAATSRATLGITFRHTSTKLWTEALINRF